jgi:hypothetical protein
VDWVYERTANNSARFVLGTIGENPLVCFGINPSTAEPNRLDRTVGVVRRVAESNGFDSFVMLNVYAQRATDPDLLDAHVDPELKIENERHIAAVIAGRSLTLWAAWGSLIDKRDYLRPLLRDIVALPALAKGNWVSRGAAISGGHPHHPLYVKSDTEFLPYSIAQYQ